MKLSLSYKTYIIMMFIFVASETAMVFLLQGSFSILTPEQQDQMMSKKSMAFLTAVMTFFLYGGLGLLGLRLAGILGFPELWDSDIPGKKRIIIPMIPGVSIGLFFILADRLFNRLHAYGPFPHPPFPASIMASITAAIGEELIFRLFFITLFVWVFSYVLFGKKYQNTVFWIFTSLSALVFSLSF